MFASAGSTNIDCSSQPGHRAFGLEFRAEGFNVFNHHDLFVNGYALDVLNTPGTIGSPLPVIALKGGLNNIATGGNHDERRFGQFSLRLSF